MKLSKQAAAVLAHLQRYTSDTGTNIATATGYPYASIRRTIQQLQDRGFHVSYAGVDGVYTLARE